MELPEIESFVTVYLEGLMICCINPKQERFEAALLRQKKHDFTIRVVTYENGRRINERETKDIPFEGVRIEIEAVENSSVKGISRYQPEPFDRKSDNFGNFRDFRWIVDLEGEEFHNRKLEPTGESLAMHRMPLTPLFIKNAHFSVSGVTDYTYDKIVIDRDGKIIDEELFGRCGFILSAHLDADAVRVSFENTGLASEVLTRRDGLTYKIFIINVRDEGDTESELPVYYKVLESPDGMMFNLEKTVQSELEAYYGKTNCSKIFLGETETIEHLS
jgi:hypothetical protein